MTTILNSKLTGNSAYLGGGAISLIDQAKLTGSGVSCTENLALNGGCSFVTEFSDFSLNNSFIADCHTLAAGGAFDVSEYASISLTLCNITYCSSGSEGSGIVARDFTKTNLHNCVIRLVSFGTSLARPAKCCGHSKNQSPGGAGLFLTSHAQATVAFTQFLLNKADFSGGAILMSLER
jgi:hypothetical protein